MEENITVIQLWCCIEQHNIIQRISKRGSVLKVMGGCYNYRFKLYKRLNVATKTVVADSFSLIEATLEYLIV